MTAPTVAPVAVARTVTMVSGIPLEVMTDAEGSWYEHSRDMYLEQTKFTENTDLKDIDRLLVLELMIFRWTQFLSAGTDYDGDLIEEKVLTANLKAYSDQVNKLKESMGLAKASRDKAMAEGDFSKWIADLKARAKIFGIHRQHQLTKALTLFEELSAILGAYDRSDAEERRKLGFESDKDILDWIRDTALPEYRQIDAYFREHSQQYWVRDQ